MPAGLGFAPALRTLPEGSFWRFEAPQPDPRPLAQGFLVELHVLADASEVTRMGSTYRYRSGTGEAAVAGDATIEGGRIARFTFTPATGGNVVMTFRISDYDSAPSVEPPPADKVLDAPKLGPCAPDGTPQPGQVACDSTGLNVDWDADVPLPAPTIKQPSTLQLRPVRAVGAGSCGQAPENPVAGQPVTLAGPDGTCYALGPAFLTVRRAEARAVRQPPGVAVAVRLDEADTAVLRRVFPDQVEKQLAMVMFGRVQSAPVVHDPDTDGNIVVAAMDAQDAANIVHSLTRGG